MYADEPTKAPNRLVEGDNESGEETVSTELGEGVPSPHSAESSDGGAGAGLLDESELELLKKLPRDEMGNPLSLGSVGHEEGSCKPCVFAHNEAKPCQNGIRCGFCHYSHPPKKRLRLCKKKRMELKKHQEEQQRAAATQEAVEAEAPGGLLDAPPWACLQIRPPPGLLLMAC